MYPGSTLFALDCLFGDQPEREALFTEDANNVLGGDILIAGGTAQFIGCTFFAITPGYANVIDRKVGTSILLLSGQASFSGCNFITTKLFAHTVGVGIHLAVLG